MEKYFLGIDVGTGSVRAAVVNSKGNILASASNPIQIWNPEHDYYEQSSEDIWKSVCISVHGALDKSGIDRAKISGIGFDATCSLVALDSEGKPVSVSKTEKDEQNIILWMDHRSINEAEEINKTQHPVLRYVGGKVSPEMEIPKCLWIFKHLPKERTKRIAKLFDLADFLTYRATGVDVRSLCTVVCKWNFMGHDHCNEQGSGWVDSFFSQIGLDSIAKEGYSLFGGKNIRSPGEKIGNLKKEIAEELGITTGQSISVAVGIIDAHAGGLGLLGAEIEGEQNKEIEMEQRLALISGTSTCHMAVSRDPLFIEGIWGPYYSAMVPGFWLTEGGQSATGALIDHVIFSHSKSAELKDISSKTGKSVYDLLNERLDELQLKQGLSFRALLTKEVHVLDYFHGNRSPRADPTLHGMISGQRLDSSIDELAILYLATIQSIAYGTKHIIEEMNKQGYHIKTIFITGGSAKNKVFVREHADITGCKIVLPSESHNEAVLLGAAVLGAVASGQYSSILEAMKHMNLAGKIVHPSIGQVAKFHAHKYRVYLLMYENQQNYKNIMESF